MPSLSNAQLRVKAGAATKLASKGHVVSKMLDATSVYLKGPSGPIVSVADKSQELTEADFDPFANAQKSRNLYADATVPSFFRRPAFSPDGELVVAPTGIHRTGAGKSAKQLSFCTHVYSRHLLQAPVASLIGLEDPSVAVRFSPVLYELVDSDACRRPGEKPIEGVIPGRYRYVTSLSFVVWIT